MNSIIVSETCTAPTAPVQVPLTQLSPLSQTCLSCPNSVHPPTTPTPPFSPCSFLYRHFYLPKPLPVHQPETPALYFSIPLAVPPVGFCSLFPGPAEGEWVGRGVRHSPLCGCGRGHFGDGVVGETRCNSVWWGLNLAMALLLLLRNTMGPRLLKETLPPPP